MSAFFSNPATCFSDTDAATIGEIVASAADLAVILNADGIVQDVAGRHQGVEGLGIANWPGRPFAGIVDPESWTSLSAAIASVGGTGGQEGVTVSHKSADSSAAFINYVPVKIGSTPNILLLGQNVSQTLTLQDHLARLQRFNEERLEREKQDETRYRALFEIGFKTVPAKTNPPSPADAGAKGVGQIPLRDLVRAQIDVFEKECIEATLKLTGNNRAAAAKVLGLSRQGLYDKLRRYGITSD